MLARFRRPGRRTALALTAGAAALVAIPVAAFASGPTDHYTGCLNTSKGTISKVKLGEAPLTACATGETKLTVSGGDITAVLAGTGLTGGAWAGNATLGLAPSYALPQGCGTGKAAKRSSTGWYCGTDFGTIGLTTAPLTADANGHNEDCDGADNPLFPPYMPGTYVKKETPAFALPVGTFQPTLAGSSRWFVNRTADRDASGYVEGRVIQNLGGTLSVVSQYDRAESSAMDGAGLPYNRDFSPFVALPGASYTVEFKASASACARSRFLDASVSFVHIG